MGQVGDVHCEDCFGRVIGELGVEGGLMLEYGLEAGVEEGDEGGAESEEGVVIAIVVVSEMVTLVRDGKMEERWKRAVILVDG